MHRDSFNTALKYITYYIVDDTLKPGYKCGIADEQFVLLSSWRFYDLFVVAEVSSDAGEGGY